MNLYPVKDYEDYMIDESGVIYSKKGYPLKYWKNSGKRPYFMVSLRKDGKTYKCLVHRLVAKTLIPNPLGLPQVNHIDGNIHNNHVNNLEWITNRGNTIHAYNMGLRRKRTIYITDGKDVHTLRGWCELLGINYKKRCTGSTMGGK